MRKHTTLVWQGLVQRMANTVDQCTCAILLKLPQGPEYSDGRSSKQPNNYAVKLVVVPADLSRAFDSSTNPNFSSSLENNVPSNSGTAEQVQILYSQTGISARDNSKI